MIRDPGAPASTRARSPTPPATRTRSATSTSWRKPGIEGGFGIMLAKGLVDEFRYNDVGNEVTLVKRFEPKG